VAEWANMGVERAVAQLLLLSFIDGKKVLEELCVGRFSFDAGISHLGQLFDEFTNTLTDLKRAAFFESWTITGQAFALGNQDCIWALVFAESWTHKHRIFQSHTHGSLRNKKNNNKTVLTINEIEKLTQTGL